MEEIENVIQIKQVHTISSTRKKKEQTVTNYYTNKNIGIKQYRTKTYFMVKQLRLVVQYGSKM